jgi:UDP-hydrolysing UDP-N-acetyl-D-glucosamine 2-epimerase
MTRRRIAFVTGTRSEYGLLRSVMEAVRDDPRLELRVVVCGMHLLPRFGNTVADILRDGLPVHARVHMQRGDDHALDQAGGLARGVQGIAAYLESARIDLVVVLGDRIEAMSGALAATLTGRILAHLHGGDVAPGDVDGVLRDAITKLAHVHFAATPASARRIVQIGEPRRRVFVVGAPGLDRLMELRRTSPKRRGDAARAVVVQHPRGRAAEAERQVMARVLRAVAACDLQRTIVYPNTDRGHVGIIRAIEEHRHASMNGDVSVHRSMPRDEYLHAVISADVVVGNSSSALIEAPAVGVPAVDVGDRQKGREAGGTAIWHAAEDETAIRRAIGKALRHRPRTGRRFPYGRGGVGARVAEHLATIALDDGLRRKTVPPREGRRGVDSERAAKSVVHR